MAGGGDPKWQKDAADQNFDYMFKLLIIGNSSVGKTSFLFRYADDSFTSAFVSTVGIDFKVKTVFRHDKRVKLQIWVSGFRYPIDSLIAYFRSSRGLRLKHVPAEAQHAVVSVFVNVFIVFDKNIFVVASLPPLEESFSKTRINDASLSIYFLASSLP